jgi:hypothetical protein
MKCGNYALCHTLAAKQAATVAQHIQSIVYAHEQYTNPLIGG